MSKRLTNIQIDGLKNHADTRLEVGPLLALAGPNGAGKTAIAQAIRLAVLGYEPAVGKRLMDTRELARGAGAIQVALTFDDGFGIRRTFAKSTDTEVAPPQGETAEKAKQERIDRETGAFVPSFDLGAFLALSAEKRREMLFGLLPRDVTGLTEGVFREWLGYDGADDPVRRAIDRLWTERVMAAQSPVDGLSSAIAFAHEHFLAAERERQTQVKVVESADAAAAQATEAVAYDPEELEHLQAELSVVEQGAGEIRERATEAERIARQYREREHQLRVLTLKTEKLGEELAAAKERVRTLTEAEDPDVAEAQRALEEAEAEFRDTPAPSAEEVQAAEHAVEHAERKLRAQREAVGYASERLEALRAELRQATATLDALAGADACPVCGSVADLVAARERLAAEATTLEARIGPAEKDLAEARRLETELDAELGRRRTHVRTLRDQQFRHRDRESKVRERAAELRTAEERRDARIRAAETDALRFGEQRDAAIEERQRLEAMELPPVPEVDDRRLVELEARAAEIRGRIRELQDLAKAAGKAEAERERADRERQELTRRERRAAALKRLHASLQKLRAHVIEQMVAPVEECANELLQTIDPQKRFRFVFEREGRDTFDFGFEEDGVFRSYDAASTGEDAFLAVVLVAALIASVQPAWRVLLVDNVEQVDEERRRYLLEALAREQHLFDNVILAGCCDFPKVDGWQVVHVDQLTASGAAAA